MVEAVFLEGLVISMLVGALLGLEREYSKKQGVIGLRTLSLLSLLGFLLVALSNFLNSTLIVFVGFVFVASLSVILYVSGLFGGAGTGFTTSISVLITYLLGVFIGFGWRTEAVFLGVLVAIVLFSKERMHRLVIKLTQREVGDLLEFLVLLGIVYPIIPTSADIFGIVVPLIVIWWIIVVISLLNFFIFIGSRYLPVQHKVELFGFLGGLINTQAIIGSLMNVYKQNKKMFQNVASGFVLINTAMYLRNFILISIIAPPILLYLGLPVVLVFLTLIPFSRLFMLIRHKEAKLKIDSPFGVWNAVKLGMAIMIVFILLDFSKSISSDALLVTSVLGGLVNSLAVSVSLGTLAAHNVISVQQAAFAFVLTNAASILSNFLVMYAAGGKEIIKKTDKALTLSVIASILGIALSLLVFSLS